MTRVWSRIPVGAAPAPQQRRARRNQLSKGARKTEVAVPNSPVVYKNIVFQSASDALSYYIKDFESEQAKRYSQKLREFQSANTCHSFDLTLPSLSDLLADDPSRDTYNSRLDQQDNLSVVGVTNNPVTSESSDLHSRSEVLLRKAELLEHDNHGGNIFANTNEPRYQYPRWLDDIVANKSTLDVESQPEMPAWVQELEDADVDDVLGLINDRIKRTELRNVEAENELLSRNIRPQTHSPNWDSKRTSPVCWPLKTMLTRNYEHTMIGNMKSYARGAQLNNTNIASLDNVYTNIAPLDNVYTSIAPLDNVYTSIVVSKNGQTWQRSLSWSPVTESDDANMSTTKVRFDPETSNFSYVERSLLAGEPRRN